jgi:hypothetical protein
MTGNLVLWVWILASPAIWFFNLAANFALVSLECSDKGKTALYLISVVSLGATAAAGALSWRQWRLLEPSRKRDMALGGTALGGLFFLVILAQAIPNLMLAGCG